MNAIQSAAAVAMTFLPLDQGRALLVVPVRLVREGAVAVARTTRHWELVLSGEAGVDLRDGARGPRASTTQQDGQALRGTPGDDVVPGMPSSGTDEPSTTTGTDEAPTEPPSADELAVDDWAELSLADAQARIAGLADAELRTLLAYERAHGHRPQYTLLLERRLEQHTARSSQRLIASRSICAYAAEPSGRMWMPSA